MAIQNQQYYGFPSDDELIKRAVEIYRKAQSLEGAGVPATNSTTHIVLFNLVEQLESFNIDKQLFFDAIDHSYK